MFTFEVVSFKFRLLEIFDDSDAIIIILGGRLRITKWKERTHDGNTSEATLHTYGDSA